MKRAWIAFTAVLVLVLPARIYATQNLLDPKTGFYADGGAVAGLISAVLAAGMLVCAFFSFREAGSVPDAGGRPVRNAAAAVFAAVAGLFVLLESFVGFSSAFGGENQILYWIFCAAGLPAGVVILTAAYCFASGSDALKRHPLAALLPSVWGCLFLALLFVTYATRVNLVENAYTTFTVIFLLLFLFTQAKLMTGIESGKSAKRIFALGFSAALVSFATAVPECMLIFSGRTPDGSLPSGLYLVFFVLAAYALVYLAAQWGAMSTQPAVVQELSSDDAADDGAGRQAQPIVVHRPVKKDEWVLTQIAPDGAVPLSPGPAMARTDFPVPASPEKIRGAFGELEVFNENTMPSLREFTEQCLLDCADFLKTSYHGCERFETRAASPFFGAQEGGSLEC